MEKQITSHIVKGAILGAFSILFSIITYVFNLDSITWLKFANIAIIAGGLIYGNILFANQNDNNVSFGNIFAHGFKTTAVLIVITVVFTVIFLNLVPEMIDKTLDLQRIELEKKPELTDEMIEQALSITKKFFMPFAIGGAIIGTGFMGAIASLIGAGVAKKNPVDPFKQDIAQ